MFQIDVSYPQGAESYRPQTVQIVPIFYGDGGSLPFSQKLAIRPHPRKINPVHDFPFSFFEIHFSITLRVVCFLQILQPETSLLFPTCHMPHQSGPHWADHPSNMWWGTEGTKLLLTPFSALSGYFLSACRVPCFLRHPVLKHRQSTFVLISPFIVNDYSLLVSTNAHIILIYTSPILQIMLKFALYKF